MNLLDFLTLLSYIGLTADITLQAHKIRQVKSSEDISVAGLVVRFLAINVILYKLISIGDMALIFGQALIALTFMVYMFVVFSFLPKPSKRKRRKR